ncbi:polyketide synthase dehydratase domain-containing protein [Kibdelosporangium philippinense]|uniref:Polyketide synthase dehydratase domain-containing protein n=1 Tax=Kibdelosporangium philippinense TaxID=211113 RepID=A0ABS8Z6Q7_9PSEU|nr:beta-ketoacyl synthase N-terminal-like domain-containing protein [Kibdelosporangium philippinense]MCE7003555.1 polyketide synthase dehydratase domain-containing protein [Kibdelosporangium philippinense]
MAIVGIGALFPAAADVPAFWHNIVGSVDAIGTIPADRWDPSIYYDPSATPASDRFYCHRGGFLDDLAMFDPTRFGIMPSTVDAAEPDQLLALGVAAAAIADAGGEQSLPDRAKVGVVVGRGGYLTPGCARLDQRVQVGQVISVVKDLIPGVDTAALREALRERLGPEQPEASIGLVPNLAASRIANRFDLLGPAYTVDAACASGLVAVEHAVRELASGRCDAMLAGAVHVSHHPTLWSVFTQLRALSVQQRIRPFDRSADGTLLSEGVGMVLLKRYSDAVANGDRIYAVIRGVGTASDGRATSMMTPNPEGQLLAVRRAWQEAGLEPGEALGLIEAHGTATPAGDAAELATMIKAFGTAGDQVGIGTVKSMIGHAMPAAGMAGLIKAALAVHHATLPPTLHIEDPHPALAGTRFEPVLEPRPWDGLRRAGVNAFGFGGINAHIVLDQATDSGAVQPDPLAPVLMLSANSAEELERELLAEDADLLSRAALRTRAEDKPCRLVMWQPDARRLKLARQIVGRGKKWAGRHDIWFSPKPLLTRNDQIAFLFPGFEHRGTAELAGEESVVEHALALLRAGRRQATKLREAGIVPSAMAGHSMGEWTAMVVAGIYPTVDQFVESLRPGMVGVVDVVYAALGCSAEKAQGILDSLSVDVVVSHDNCPHQSVICGPAHDLARAVESLTENGIMAQVMPFRTGFHTPALAPHLDGAKATVSALTVHPPSIPVWSATSLAPMPDDPAAIRELVLRHLVEPVRFRPLLQRLHDSGIRAFVQVGAGSLPGFVDDTLSGQEFVTIAGDSEHRAAAALWAFGLQRGHGGKLLSLGLKRFTLDPLSIDQPVTVDASTDVGAALSAVLAETTAVAREVAEALAAPKPTEVELSRVFSVQTMPYLVDHSIFPQPEGWHDLSDGFPIVPITGLVEVIKDAARAVVPSGVVTAVESVRAMRWLDVEPGREVRITAKLDGGVVRVRVGDYAEGVVRFGSGYPEPESRTYPPLRAPRPAPVTANELYGEGWMFHGPRFAGVSEITTLADNGITGELTVLPASGALLDCAGQLIGHWMQVSRDVDQTVLPTGIGAVRYYGPDPEPGSRISCEAWILDVTAETMRADAVLRTSDGRLWCRIEGWATRRFTTDDRIWQVKLRPELNTLAEPQDGGWVLVTEKWADDSATRELMARRYMTASERAHYSSLDLRTRRQWLLRVIAAKDAVRRWLWDRGVGAIFPVELTVTDDGSSVQVRGAFATPKVSVAQWADPTKPSAPGCAVAIAGDTVHEIVVTDDGTSYAVTWKQTGEQRV